MTDDVQSKLEDVERENERLRGQLKELHHLEEDLMAQRAFEKAKKQLFSWLTFSGILLTVVALFGVKELYNYMTSKIDGVVQSYTEEQIDELITEATVKVVTARLDEQEAAITERFEAREEDLTVRVSKQVRKVVESIDTSSELRVEPVISMSVAKPPPVELAPEMQVAEEAIVALDEAADAALEETVERFYDLPEQAKEAVRQGDLAAAEDYAKEALDLADRFPDDWNYGNAIHDGNVVLGMVALDRGDVDAAKAHLLEAGKTPGSPQLDSFGPNMMLAEALIKAGETDVVLEYFELVRAFWELDDGQLDRWTDQVRKGETPDFRANLRY